MVEVVESCMVVPSEKTPQHALWLSNLDILLAQMGYSSIIYFYPASSSSIFLKFFPMDAIKNVIAKALVPFYPLAGRLVKGADGRLEIDCNAAGALFVVAKSELTLDSWTELEKSSELIEMFLPSIHGSPHQYPSVLLMIQITFLKCGGMAFGIARHHAVNDGRSMFQFLMTCVCLARGCTGVNLPPLPFIDRTILRARSPPVVQFDHPEYSRRVIKPSQTPNNMTSIMFEVKLSQDQINILKCSGKPDSIIAMSTFSVVAAHVWKCVCAARGLTPETTARLVIIVDIRNRLRPPLPQQYLGNAAIATSMVARVHDVLVESVAGLAQKIKGMVDRVDDSYARSAIDCMELMGDSGINFFTDDGKPVSELRVVSWLGMPALGADFGFGPPKFMIRGHVTADTNATVINDRAGISVQISLERETMSQFKDLFYETLLQMTPRCRI